MDLPALLKRVAPTLVALAVMMLASVAYFAPQLSGKVIGSGDTLANRAMTQEIRDYEAATGRRSLWTNSMFGGMPTYQMSAPERGNLLRYVQRAVYGGFERPIGYFFSIMAGMFLLLRVLGVHLWLSTLGAIAFGLGTNHVILFDAGHMTKLRAISFMAPTLAGLFVLFSGRFLGGLALFSTALGLQVFANHPQMTYYLAAACAVFVAYRLIEDWRAGQLPRFAKALGLSLVGAALAIGASFTKITTTLEYAEETIRGKPVLTAAAVPGTPAATTSRSGLAWDAAMAWSNGFEDVFAGYVYGAAGGSVAEPVERTGPIGTALRRAGNQVPPNLELPLYHGTMPMTNGPVYFGAVGVFLFIVGLFWLPPGWRYFFGASVLVTLLISMGRHAEWLNRFLFDTAPLFRNFRAPSSATSVTGVLVFAGACYGLWVGLRQNDRDAALRRFYLGAGVAGGLLLVVALLGPALLDLTGGRDGGLAQAGIPLDALYEERADLLTSSAWRGVGFVALVAAAIWAALRGTLSLVPALTIVGVLAVADVWGVSRRYLSTADFSVPARANASLDARPVDGEILRDPTLHYRVHDVTRNAFGDAVPGNFHNLIGGYHAAKLRRYQDLIERHLSKGTPAVLSMLNTRYVITGQPGAEQAQRNPGALGNAWLVREARVVPDANAEIAALDEIDPANTAAVHAEFADDLSATSFTGAGSVELTSYAPDRLTYRFASDQAQLVVFSEIWYGPDKGWRVTIDGEPAELMRANYALRALEVPAGEHEIVMWFEPATFARGELVSYVSSGIICLLGLAALYFAVVGRRSEGHAVIVDDRAAA